MTEQVLLNSGYKLFIDENPKHCDRFYQKKLDDKRHFNIYYYEYSDSKYNAFEYELYIEKEHYVITKYLYGLDKNYSYTIEEIENILLEENNE